jgi:hypothetical protein
MGKVTCLWEILYKLSRFTYPKIIIYSFKALQNIKSKQINNIPSLAWNDTNDFLSVISPIPRYTYGPRLNGRWPVSSEHWCTSPTLVIIILCQNSLFPCLSIQLDQEQLQDGDNSFQLYVFFPWHRLWHAKGLSEWMMGWVPDECIRGRVKCQFLLSKSSWLASGGSFIYGTFQFHRLHVTMTLWPWGSAGRRRKGSPE